MSFGQTATGDPEYRATGGLFSARYLDDHLPATDRWAAADRTEVREARSRIRARYRAARRRADELAARISALEDAIDGIVYRLYGVDNGEIAALEGE